MNLLESILWSVAWTSWGAFSAWAFFIWPLKHELKKERQLSDTRKEIIEHSEVVIDAQKEIIALGEKQLANLDTIIANCNEIIKTKGEMIDNLTEICRIKDGRIEHLESELRFEKFKVTTLDIVLQKKSAESGESKATLTKDPS